MIVVPCAQCKSGIQTVSHWPFQTLHKTDPALFIELSCNTTQPTTSLEGDNKLACADAFDDPSNISVDVIEQHVVSGIIQGGFLVDDNGCLMHSTVVEDDDFKVNDHLAVEAQSIVLHQATASGHGQQKKEPSKPFGGLGWDWEECV